MFQAELFNEVNEMHEPFNYDFISKRVGLVSTDEPIRISETSDPRVDHNNLNVLCNHYYVG